MRARAHDGAARFWAAWLLAAALALGSRQAAAQNQVYDPLPPPGSAYVRFVSAVAAELAITPDFLPAQRLGPAVDSRVTSYGVVERVAGRDLVLDARAGDRVGHASVHAEPGSFLTVIVEAGPAGTVKIVPVVDRTDFNQSRARLSFYNATPDCADASLTLVPGGPAVFQAVPPGTAKARSVNPVTAQVQAVCAGQSAPPFALTGLEAGGMYSIWLMLLDGHATAFVNRDTTARWRG
jgi:hypothetical protein